MNLKIISSAGDNFKNISQKAKRMAAKANQTVEFEFNGIVCLVDRNTNLNWLWRDYTNAWTMEWKTVGANCVPAYPIEIQEELDKRNKAAEEVEALRMEEYRKKEEKERFEFEEKVKGLDIELKDVVAWQENKEANKDPYGKCAVDYAEDWAKLMQMEMSKGNKLEDIAERTSFELGFFGITGFMYGAAVSMLSQCWKYGEQLRKWHNKEYNHEGDGVVNPAILTFSA